MRKPLKNNKRWMRSIARRGGQNTLAKLGPEHFRALAAKKRGMKYKKRKPKPPCDSGKPSTK